MKKQSAPTRRDQLPEQSAMGTIFRKRIRVKPTLRGLVVTDHPKNPRDRVGEVIPYLGIDVVGDRTWMWDSGPHDAKQERYFVEHGHALACRAQRRAVAQAFAQGDLEPEFVAKQAEPLLLAIGKSFVILLTMLAFLVWAHLRDPREISQGAALGFLVAFASMLAAGIVLHRFDQRRHTAYVKVTRNTLLTRDWQGRERILEWSSLVRAHRGFSSYIILDFGPLGRVIPAVQAHAELLTRWIDCEREQAEMARRRGWLGGAIICTGLLMGMFAALSDSLGLEESPRREVIAFCIASVMFGTSYWIGPGPWMWAAEQFRQRGARRRRHRRRRSTGSHGERP